jgi:acetylornithine deacetylase/succinyl-diaminopimelate desuccinylase-like protein
MRSIQSRVQAAVDAVSEAEVTSLVLQLANIPGPSGHESRIGEAVLQWLKGEGIQTERQEVAPERFNVVGRLRSPIRGAQRGKSLILNAHLDVAEGTPGDLWGPNFEPSFERDGLLYGKALLNDRAGVTAMLLAQAAIKRSGLRLRGDLLTAAVVGEIGMAPVDEFEGITYVGKGLGTRHLVGRGGIADFALVAETTDWGITWIECGAAYFRVTIPGEAIYTPRVPTQPASAHHPNAILRAQPVVSALEAWGRGYERRNTRQYAVGAVVPKTGIGAMRAGWAPKPNRSAGAAWLYLDVRLPPGETPLAAQREIEEAIVTTGVDATVDCYLYHRGYVGQGVEPLVDAARTAYRAIVGEDPPPVPTHVTSMWRDINVFAEVGIPAITFGPPRRPGTLSGEQTKTMAVADLTRCVRMYILIAAELCGVIE